MVHKIAKIIYRVGFVVAILCSAGLFVLFYWSETHPYLGSSNEEATLQVSQEEEKELLQSSSTLEQAAEKSYPEKYQNHFGILMYHYINNDPTGRVKRLAVRPEIFEAQVEYLFSQGYSFITLGEAMQQYAATTTLPIFEKTVALTFDDGFRSFYTDAFPVLKKYNIPASIFVITSDVGKRGNVTWDMLKELRDSGLVEIGSHTVKHKNLTKITNDSLKSELVESKKILEKELGIEIKTLAYPFGVYNFTTEQAARDAGYLGAVSVFYGPWPNHENLFNWRRVMMTNADIGPLILKKIYFGFEFGKPITSSTLR